jgi:chromosome segregation ATPase
MLGFCYRNAKKCSEKIENMEQEIQDCEKKMMDMQKEQEKVESDGQVILDELKTISVCSAVRPCFIFLEYVKEIVT